MLLVELDEGGETEDMRRPHTAISPSVQARAMCLLGMGREDAQRNGMKGKMFHTEAGP